MAIVPPLSHLIESLITSAICFVCLWPLRRFLGFAEHETIRTLKKRRKQIIKTHVHDGHTSKLNVCREDDCQFLSVTFED